MLPSLFHQQKRIGKNYNSRENNISLSDLRHSLSVLSHDPDSTSSSEWGLNATEVTLRECPSCLAASHTAPKGLSHPPTSSCTSEGTNASAARLRPTDSRYERSTPRRR